ARGVKRFCAGSQCALIGSIGIGHIKVERRRHGRILSVRLAHRDYRVADPELCMLYHPLLVCMDLCFFGTKSLLQEVDELGCALRVEVWSHRTQFRRPRFGRFKALCEIPMIAEGGFYARLAIPVVLVPRNMHRLSAGLEGTLVSGIYIVDE